MRRLIRSAAFGAIALLTITMVASCAYTVPPALMVKGPGSAPAYELSDADFQTALKALANDKTLMTALLREPIDPYADPSKTAYNPVLVTGVLSVLAKLQIIVNAAGELKVIATDAQMIEAEKSIAESFGGATSDPQTGQQSAGDPVKGQAALSSLGPVKDLLKRYVAVQAGFTKATAPTEDDLREVYDGAKDRLGETVCASHILITGTSGATDPDSGEPVPLTEADYAAALAKAEDLEKQLAAGADFAAVATANSEDPGSATNGGKLDCVSEKGSFVQEFDDALWSQQVGEVGQPVKSQFGYHIIKVASREVPSFEQVRDQIEQAIAQDATDKAATAAFEKATVTVDPRYGRWDAASATVLAPDAASDPTIPTTTTTFALDPFTSTPTEAGGVIDESQTGGDVQSTTTPSDGSTTTVAGGPATTAPESTGATTSTSPGAATTTTSGPPTSSTTTSSVVTTTTP